MKWVYRLIRTLLVTALILVAAVPAVLYVALSIDGVQRLIARRAETELSRLLDAKVSVGSLGIIPFNRVVLKDVSVETAPGDTCLSVRHLGAGVSLFEGITTGKWRINYVELIGADARLRRDSLAGELNIAPIMAALQPKDKDRPPTPFDLKVVTVVMRGCRLRYDVLDQPHIARFDPNHLDISRLRADISAPRLTNEDFTINLHRLALEEQSGLTLKNLAGNFHISNEELAVADLQVELPASALWFDDVRLPLDSIRGIAQALDSTPVDIKLKEGAHIWLPDLKAFLPPVAAMEEMALIPRLNLRASRRSASASLRVELEQTLTLDLQAQASDLTRPSRSVSVQSLEMKLDGSSAADLLRRGGWLTPQVHSIVAALGATDLTLSGELRGEHLSADMGVASSPGKLSLQADGVYSSPTRFDIAGELATEGYFDIAALLPRQVVGGFEGNVTASYAMAGTSREGEAEFDLNNLTINGQAIEHVEGEATLRNDHVTLDLAVEDDAARLNLAGEGSVAPGHPEIIMQADIARFIPDRFGIRTPYPGGALSASIDIDLRGELLRSLEGFAEVTELTLKPVNAGPVTLHSLRMDATALPEGAGKMVITSDFLDGTLCGFFDIPHLGNSIIDIFAIPFPALLPERDAPGRRTSGADPSITNDFTFDFTVKETERIAEFFKFPVSVIYPVKIVGGVSLPTHDIELNISAPYLRQGAKLIENTSLSAYVDGTENRARLDFVTTYPTKGGPLTLNLNASGHDDLMRTGLSWNIDRERRFDGDIKVVTTFARTDRDLTADIALRHSFLTFNDSTWTLRPASVRIRGKEIDVDSIDASHGSQFVKINGRISPDPTALLTLDLSSFSLDYLFESLGIDAAMLGGDASGTFYASDLYSPTPRLETPGLNVHNISYNQTVLGDALVRAGFDIKQKAVMLNADIADGKRHSTVNGGIYIARDSLDLSFDVDRVPVGFLGHYMQAFADNVRGYASGHARVFGNFKYIDLEGDVLADSVALKIKFTNTDYWASDSVHIRPGHISLDGLTIHDFMGHSARLNGNLTHQYFKEPRFDFAITGARSLLCYDETPRENPRWYGRVFGDGSAYIRGIPGLVDITVDMTTAPQSTFTFVLLDQVEADEYSFLTFRDSSKMMAEMTDTIKLRDTSMDLVNRLRDQAAAHGEESSSDYNINIQMGITPEAQISLVMDPVGGDRIRANGSGHVRMEYGSATNELKMFGTYTLDRGDYNFTLQDIILKDFTIKPGSNIIFAGDPYGAQLDINAAYSLNANLSDLDESFLNDPELNRTNVPVNALMKVSGDIRQPEIAFDLEFPTLNADIYRKVRSIISTDEMMNRQILYLLALNRFYTPEYMAGATRGNELVSVASSTISSQLGSILGQISDNWNIAPTFRSSRGDFSDMEVDLALSSRLLNNRLLFNGNFGYRDKSLNTNQFVGDFDLEYLLNRSGNFRLKAYNRYNDQNYYLRQSLTTQGVGIILRKDFDSLADLFRSHRPIRIPLAPTPSNPSNPSNPSEYSEPSENSENSEKISNF